MSADRDERPARWRRLCVQPRPTAPRAELSHTEYGNLEDSDIGLFASAFAPVAEASMTLLLSEGAVNYAVRGRQGSGIEVAGGQVQPGFLIEADMKTVGDGGRDPRVRARGRHGLELVRGGGILERPPVGCETDAVEGWGDA